MWLGEQTQITNVLWQSVNPEWEEALFFREICAASELVVEVSSVKPHAAHPCSVSDNNVTEQHLMSVLAGVLPQESASPEPPVCFTWSMLVGGIDMRGPCFSGVGRGRQQEEQAAAAPRRGIRAPGGQQPLPGPRGGPAL